MTEKDDLRKRVRVVILGDQLEISGLPPQMIRQLIQTDNPNCDSPEKEMLKEVMELAAQYEIISMASRPGARFGEIPKGFDFANNPDERLTEIDALAKWAEECGLGTSCGASLEFPFGKPRSLQDALMGFMPRTDPSAITLYLLEDADGEVDQLKRQVAELQNRLIEMAESEKVMDKALNEARNEIWELNAVNGINDWTRRVLAKDAISNPLATVRNCRKVLGMPMHTPNEAEALCQMFDGGSELPTDLEFLRGCYYLTLDIISQARKILAGHDDIKQPSWTVKQLQNLLESYFAPEKAGTDDCTGGEQGFAISEDKMSKPETTIQEVEFDGGREKIDKAPINEESSGASQPATTDKGFPFKKEISGASHPD